MHPMERLRYVARAGSAGAADASLVVAETVEALARLRPSEAELVTVCRQLVQRNPACGPLWWLGARLLAGGLDQLWDVGREFDDDPTAALLADALPDGATVLAVGCPEIAARALVRRGDVEVLAVDAGPSAPSFVRMLDRADVAVNIVDPAGMHAAAEVADLAIVEVVACSDEQAIVPLGGALLAAAALSAGTAVWLVTALGTRLPRPFVDAAVMMSRPEEAPWDAGIERVALRLDACRDRVCGPGGVERAELAALRPDCPYTAELIPPTL
jgi:hypothetical protein